MIPDIKFETIVCNQNHIQTDRADIIIVKLDKSIHTVFNADNNTIVIIT
jgi:hypothetical protein